VSTELLAQLVTEDDRYKEIRSMVLTLIDDYIDMRQYTEHHMAVERENSILRDELQGKNILIRG